MCETENPNSSGNSACSRAISVPLPTPLGPQTTTGRFGGAAVIESFENAVVDDACIDAAALPSKAPYWEFVVL